MKKMFLLLLMMVLFIPGYYPEETAFAGTLQASVVRINISPEEPQWFTGFGTDLRPEPSKGVHDDIYMKILALDDGDNRVFIVATDLIGIREDYYTSFTERLESETGIQKEQLLWTFTHTHAAPMITESGRNPEYSQMIKDKLIEGLKTAGATLQPAKIGVGFGRSFMNINRRATYPDGSVNLARDPYGIVDREFGVVRIETNDGTLMALLVNYPCHGVGLSWMNSEISGDVPGSAARCLEEKLPDNAMVMYLNGAAGDVEPVYTVMHGFTATNFNLDILGLQLSGDVLEICNDINMTDRADIATLQKVINLPRKESEREKSGPVQSFRISIIRVNDIVFAGASGEIFNQIGIHVKHMSPYAKTLFVGYTNGSSGYLPTKAAYPEGGYEIRVTHVSPEGESIFTHSMVELLRDMKVRGE